MIAPNARQRRKGRSGSSLLEFAIGWFVIALSFTGIFEFGYAFYIYNNLQTAVNNGAKYAALRTYIPNSSTPDACFKTAVQDMVAYGDPTGTATTPIAPGLAPGNVFLVVTFANGVPSQMQVGVANYTINAAVGSIRLTNKPQVTYPYVGRYAEGDGETCVQ